MNSTSALKERVPAVVNQNKSESQTQRILVVDDENSISELIATSLRFVGFDVRTAATGSQALAVAEEFKPHALILDVMLPDQDGFDVCRQLRQDGHSVGVLFLTAKDTVEDKIAGLTIGGDDYMTKPFSLEELVARLRALLRRIGRTGRQGGRTDRRLCLRLAVDDVVHADRGLGRPVGRALLDERLHALKCTRIHHVGRHGRPGVGIRVGDAGLDLAIEQRLAHCDSRARFRDNLRDE